MRVLLVFLCLLGFLGLPIVAQALPSHIQLQLKWKHQFQFAGYYMALQKGYYRDAGLDVEILEGGSGRSAFQFVTQGEHRYAVGEASDMLADNKVQKTRILMAVYQHSPVALVVREDSGIRGFSDLKGRRLMLNYGKKGSEILASLLAAGVDMEDIQIEKNNQQALELLQQGLVDGVEIYRSNEPYTLNRMGVPYRILHPQDEGVDFYNDFLLTSTSEVKHDPQQVRAFVKASEQGWRYVMLHPEEAIALIQKKYNSQHLSHEQLAYEATILLPLLDWNHMDLGYISEHRLNLMEHFFVKLGLLDKPRDMHQFIYDINHLNDREIWLEAHAWQLLGVILFALLMVAVSSLIYARKVIKRKTASLKESEAMWRHFVDIADIGIFMHRQGKILFANAYMLERMALSAEEALGVDIAKHVYPEDLPMMAKRVQDVMAHGDVVRGEEIRYVSASGTMFDVEISSSRIVFEGEFAVLGVARDMTAKNKSEKALQASEAQYRQLVERSPDAVLVHQDGVWCFANPIGLEMMGAETAGDLLGQSVLKSVYPDDRAMVIKRMKSELLDGETAPLAEERLLRLDGTTFWAEVTGIPMEHEGRPASLVIARDITAKKVAEMALRQEKRKLKIILDYAPIGIWMTDLHGKLQLVNKIFTDAWGISERDLMAADQYLDLLPDEAAASCIASDQACIQGKKRVMVQESSPCIDGKVYVFDVIKGPVFNDDGVMVGIVGLAIDATERIEAQAEKERMQHQIEHTQRLESLGVLAGGIAHDFNNILAVMMGNASLMRRKIAENLDVSKYLERIVEASEKASLLCGQMLAYSGQGKIAIRPLNITEMSQSIASLLGVSIGVDIELSYDLDENLPMIDADEAQMQQVIMNLVINASEAMAESGGHIDLTTRVQRILPVDLEEAVGNPDMRLAESYVCLQVLDNGCGMSKEVAAHIFEPFFTTKFTGRGLGMSAILGIIQAHHGCLSLHTRQGEGTRFRVFFPISTVEMVNEIEEVLPEVHAVNVGKTVLLIDDDAMIREAVGAMIEDFGYVVLLAEGGAEGVALYTKHQADIHAVVLDMTMPNMNGLQCFLALKKVNLNVKVFLSSGFQEEAALQDSKAEGLAGFIQKPYLPEVLEAALRNV